MYSASSIELKSGSFSSGVDSSSSVVQVVDTHHHILGGADDRLAAAGLEQILAESISCRASSTADWLSGTCTAIWSPSKSA